MIKLRTVTPQDSEAITSLYNHYVSKEVTTFEETPVSVAEMRSRIETISANYPFLAMTEGEKLVGYAYGSIYRARRGYRFTVETTIYLAPAATAKGYGTELYRALIAELKARDFRSAIGVIALPNPASVSLHEKLGFVKVAHLKNVGRKFDQWVDTGYWQLDLTQREE